MFCSCFRKISLFLLLLTHYISPVFANDKPDSLRYSIRPLFENGKTLLDVCLEFQGNGSGVTEIVLPSSWAGQDELYSEISGMHSDSLLDRIEDTELPEIKKIHHLPNAIIKLNYQVVSREKKEIEWYYRPLVQETYFFIFGYSLFVFPRMDDQKPAHISVQWQDFPSEWTLANSFGVNQKIQELFLPLAIFRHAVYSGGDFEILQCGKPNAPIFVAIRGKWSFSNERLTELIQTIIESHRQFWNDFDFPYYLITVLPIGDDRHMGGTGLSNAFSIFSGDLSDENKEDWRWLTWLLSHEHFHTWNGVKMMSRPFDGSMYWFTEGFTEYYATKLNFHAQLIDTNQYVDHVNSILYDYYTSPVRNENNERIPKDFWNDRNVQKLPYVRGFLFALNWDKKIKEMSHNQYSLDDFMRALLKKTKENKFVFTQEDIEQVASSFLPIKIVQEDLEKYILKGETFIPNEEDFNNRCTIEWRGDVGFNLHQAIYKEKIEGVKEGSNAFESGLRNGQKFLKYSYVDQTISVSVIDKEGAKEVKYLQESIIHLVPQYKLQGDLVKSNL